MAFEQTGGQKRVGIPDGGQPPSPDVSVKTALMVTFVLIVMTAATLFLAGLLAYPAWELLKIGWNIWT